MNNNVFLIGVVFLLALFSKQISSKKDSEHQVKFYTEMCYLFLKKIILIYSKGLYVR
jgi:hypothetical protein